MRQLGSLIAEHIESLATAALQSLPEAPGGRTGEDPLPIAMTLTRLGQVLCEALDDCCELPVLGASVSPGADTAFALGSSEATRYRKHSVAPPMFMQAVTAYREQLENLLHGRLEQPQLASQMVGRVVDRVMLGFALGQKGSVASAEEGSLASTRAQLAAGHPAGIALWQICPATGQFIAVSEGVEAIRGVSPAELLADPEGWLCAVHPDDRTRVCAALTAARAGQSAVEEYRLNLPEAEDRWVCDYILPVRDDHGGLNAILGVSLVLCEQKSLARQRTLLASVMDSVSDAVAIVDLDGRLLEASRGLADLLGWDVFANGAGDGLDLIHSDAATTRAILRATADGEPWCGSARVSGAEGQRCTVDVTTAPTWDSSGVVVGATVSYRPQLRAGDPAPAPRARQERRDEHAVQQPPSHQSLLERLLERSPDMVFQLSVLPELSFEYVSPAALAVTGYTSDDHYSDAELWFRAVHPEDRESLMEVLDPEFDFKQTLRLRWVTADNQTLTTEQRMTPVFDDATGALTGIEGIVRSCPAGHDARRPDGAARESWRDNGAGAGSTGLGGLELGAEYEEHVLRLSRVLYLSRWGLPTVGISGVTGMSPELVEGYLGIMQGLQELPASVGD